MQFEDERYARLYTRDTVNWLSLKWEGKATWALLIRKLPKNGRIEVSDAGARGMRGLAGVIQLPPEIVEVGIADLVESGTLIWEQGGTVLFAPKFFHAQTCRSSAKARKAKQRENESAGDGGEEELEEDGHDEQQPVTKRHTNGATGTGGHETRPSGAELAERSGTSGAEPPDGDGDEQRATPRKRTGLSTGAAGKPARGARSVPPARGHREAVAARQTLAGEATGPPAPCPRCGVLVAWQRAEGGAWETAPHGGCGGAVRARGPAP